MEKHFHSTLRRYYEVELPHNHTRLERWPLLIALHGYEGNKESMMRVAKHIAGNSMVVVSLQGPYQFFRAFGKNSQEFRVGFGWGTTYKMEDSVQLHHRDLETIIRDSVLNYQADPQRIFLLAFSQACSLNYRYVFTHPRTIRGVVSVCGGVPGDWNDNPRYRPAATHVLHIAARKDEWYSPEKNLDFKRQLAQRSATLDFRFYDSPHRFPRTSIPHIRRWIENHL